MYKNTLHTCRKSVRFRCWSRKNYAVFGSLHRHVTIGKVCKGIADSALNKAKNILFQKECRKGMQAKEDKEELPEDAGILQWYTLQEGGFLWLMTGSVAGSEVCAKYKLYYLSFIEEEWQSSLMCICKDARQLLCHSSFFYLYHYDRKTGKENK